MSNLFEDRDDDQGTEEFNINSDYAKNYDKWRQKEEIHKLKTKYGDVDPESGSSSESSSEDEEVLDEINDKDFLKTLACLKSKDPKIYQQDVKFFEDRKPDESKKKEKKQKDGPLLLKDYERNLLLEKNGEDSDDDMVEPKTLTSVQEQQMIKEGFKSFLNNEDDDENEDGLLVKKDKTEEEKKKENEAYVEWLKGRETEINSEEKSELKPLRDYWTDPNLDASEKFLRDYILNKKFLENDQGEYEDDHYRIHESEDNLSEDENEVEKQEEFEHKYNFRFEEPDQEFIKRYPRTIENSMRKKNTKRAEKRVELKKRKEDEKVRRKEDLKQLKAMKLKEIQEKIDKLKEISGNDDIKFEHLDLEGDFDPDEHERKMNEIYNDDFYSQPEGDVKPQFPDIDEELELESTWDTYDPTANKNDDNDYGEEDGPHCEDEEFNMDADYDPKKSVQEQLIDSMKRRKGKRKSKFREMLKKEKPLFDPEKYSDVQKYYDQYYSLDYEDMIGDLPCRMKYNKVEPNSYGLSVEEILMADDKELNKWYSLKRALKIKNPNVERNEAKTFNERRKNENLMRKILPSLFRNPDEEEEPEGAEKTESEVINAPSKSARRRKNKKLSQKIETNGVDKKKTETEAETVVEETPERNQEEVKSETQLNNRKRKLSEDKKQDVEPEAKKKKKKKKKKKSIANGSGTSPQKKAESQQEKPKKTGNANFVAKKKNLKKGAGWKKEKDSSDPMKTREDTLKGYEINPKKFKNKLKYGKKKEL